MSITGNLITLNQERVQSYVYATQTMCGEPRCSEKVSNSCSMVCTRRVTPITNPVSDKSNAERMRL